MPAVLSDFHPLKPAEQTLVEWLQAGERGYCLIGQTLPPETPPKDKTIRASFVRYLALGGCDDCRLPKTGLRVQGAYIEGDDDKGGETKGLDLEGANLPHDLGLAFCRFPDRLLLRSANLRSLFLRGSHLQYGLEADRITCRGSLFLRDTIVQGKVRLRSVQIDNELNCNRAQLKAGLSADRLRCDGSVFLRRVIAQGSVRFVGAQIGGSLSCVGARLEALGKSLNVGRARIVGSLFLRDNAKVAGAINLTDAQIGAIHDDPECWPKEILLDRCRYGAFLGNDAPVTAEVRLKWLALQNPQKYGKDFEASSYEHCAKVLREMGYGGEATKVLIEKDRLQRRARRDRLRKDTLIEDAWGRAIWDRIMAYTVRYGRQPLWAFVWLFGFWLLGAMVFAQANALGAVMPNHPQFQLSPAWVECHSGDRRAAGAYPHQLACFHAQPEAASYTSFSALAYSADTLFPLVSLEIQSYWIPDNRTTYGAFARAYLWFHIAAGWGLSLLAVAGFSGLIKNDTSS